MGTLYLGFVASLIAGMGTAVGALPILFTTKLTKKWQGILLGLGGGVMLAATTFSLIIPGTEAAIDLGYSQKQAAFIVSVGLILGAGVVSFGQAFLPWGMAAAAGAMLFVIVDEIIPEIDHQSIAQEGTLGIMSGFVAMMFLDIAFG